MSKLINEIEKKIMNEPLFAESFRALEMIESGSHIEMHGDEDMEVLEIKANTTKEDRTRLKMLKLYRNQNNQIIISNIFLPSSMRKQGLGMKMLSIIYETAKAHNNEVFIDDMVPAFYKKMIARGANPMNNEAVQIHDETRLYANKAHIKGGKA